MKKKIVLISILLLFFVLLQPATAVDDYTIQGQVVDEINKSIEGKEIALKQLKENEFVQINSATTNSNGEFIFEGLEENRAYLLEMSHQGVSYKRIIDSSTERNITFRINEISDKGIIKGQIRGLDEARLVLWKDNEIIREKEVNSQFYKFTDLMRNKEYVISLVKDGVFYNKSFKTDEDPLNSQIVDFSFDADLSIELNFLGEKKESEIETRLFYNDELIESSLVSEEINYNGLLRNANYRIEVSYNEGRYVRNYLAGSKINKVIDLFGDSELVIRDSDIEINVLNGTSPNLFLQESYELDKTSFFLNNTLEVSKSNFSTIRGKVDLSLPNNEIKNLTVNLNSLSSFDVNKNNLSINFDDLKINEDEEIILTISYTIEEDYNKLLSREVVIQREYNNFIDQINVTFDINKNEKHNVIESLTSDFNVTKNGYVYTLSNINESSSFKAEISWGTISDLQLLIYGGIILVVGLLVTYAAFIALIGEKREIKKEIEEKDEDTEIMNKAAEAALRRLRTRYENDEISKEEYEEKKEKYIK